MPILKKVIHCNQAGYNPTAGCGSSSDLPVEDIRKNIFCYFNFVYNDFRSNHVLCAALYKHGMLYEKSPCFR